MRHTRDEWDFTPRAPRDQLTRVPEAAPVVIMGQSTQAECEDPRPARGLTSKVETSVQHPDHSAQSCLSRIAGAKCQGDAFRLPGPAHRLLKSSRSAGRKVCRRGVLDWRHMLVDLKHVGDALHDRPREHETGQRQHYCQHPEGRIERVY